MFVGEPDRPWDLDSLRLGVSNELVGDLLDGIEPVAAEGDSGSLELGILNALFLGILVSHLSGGNNINYLWLIIKIIIFEPQAKEGKERIV